MNTDKILKAFGKVDEKNNRCRRIRGWTIEVHSILNFCDLCAPMVHCVVPVSCRYDSSCMTYSPPLRRVIYHIAYPIETNLIYFEIDKSTFRVLRSLCLVGQKDAMQCNAIEWNRCCLLFKSAKQLCAPCFLHFTSLHFTCVRVVSFLRPLFKLI